MTIKDMLDGIIPDAMLHGVQEQEFDQEIHEALCDVYGIAKGDKVFKLGLQIIKIEERLGWYNDLIHAGRHYTVEPIKPHMIYNYEPVDVKTFIEDRYYLDKRGEIYPLLLDNLIEVNSGKYQEAIWTGGIGSGKTTGALYTILYQVYLLSCLKNPHALFQLDPSSEIVTIFQSISAKLAKELDYARFKSMVEGSKYFKDNFPFDKDITSKLIFPNRIEVHAVSGLETAAIGQNVIQALMDELNYMAKITKSKKGIDGGDFNQAIALYESIARRRKSRFNTAGGKLPGVLCLVSSKRYPGQFTDTKESQRSKEIAQTGKSSIFLYDKRMWDVNPSKFSDKTFQVFIGDESRKPRVLLDHETVSPEDRHLVDHIPIDFRDDFSKDITNALREIAGKSTLASHPFIINTEAITLCMDRKDSVFSEDSVDFVIDQLFLYPKNLYKPELPRYAHIDLGITGDSAGLTIGTIKGFSKVIRSDDSVGEMLPNYHIDGSLEVRPPKGGEILFWKIRNILYKLRDLGLNIRWVSLDSFQSVDTLQTLRQKGFSTGMISMDRTALPYELTKHALYDGRISMPFHARLRHELASLEYDPSKGKVDHPSTDGASKDCSDSLAGVIYGLLSRRELWALHNISPVEFPAYLQDKKEIQKPPTSGYIAPERGTVAAGFSEEERATYDAMRQR